MAAQSTIAVPHLGGITAGYRLSEQPGTKPVLVLINSMCTTSSLYAAQFASKPLTDVVTLLAIEPLAHGATRYDAGHYTYWDSAAMALQVMDKLGIQKAFALGTSQGGWIVVRMALLAPERILGLIPLGTSMDYESSYSRSKGCWDPRTSLAPFLDAWSSARERTPDFVVDNAWCTAVGSLGFSGTVTPETLQFWSDTLKSVYRGDEGRRMLRMALINLVERDGLLWRLRDVRCPVYWLQGTKDIVYGTELCKEHIELFVNAVETELVFVEGGGHYLNATSPAEVEAAVLKMVGKYYAAVGRSRERANI